MKRLVICRRAARALALAALLIVHGACGGSPADDPPETLPGPPGEERVEGPAEVVDPATGGNADMFLPPLDGYIIEEADAGELEESLAHGSVAPVEVRRRLILDEQGFTRGAVTVVTFEANSDGVEPYLEHRFGAADRTPVELGGVQMLRIDAEPHAVLAWTDPAFVVTFERGQEVSDEWLEDLARATVAATAPGTR